MSQVVTRFAPSPTGRLHLGHAFSALTAWHAARQARGRFLLRIEDIDRSRSRPEFVGAIETDLAWLGLDWDGPVRIQSEHMDDYRSALDRLEASGLVYPCFCTRGDIADEIRRSGAAPHGPDGPLYPGTCRSLAPSERERRIGAGAAFALRLDAERASAGLGRIAWTDRERGAQELDAMRFGDVVLARKDVATSYHLAVTVDDAIQGVSLVTRGIDLFEATHVHRLLQALLGLPTPEYHHHRLLVDREGRRYAKRDRAMTLAELGEAGHTPEAVRRMAGFK
jgi:glutamyl-Q tRNA(Asp) synthetase